MRRATGCITSCAGCWGNFYPRPPRGGRRYTTRAICRVGKISIHALREEGDKNSSAAKITPRLFLSTPSARRATSYALLGRCMRFYFYPRPPRGGRPERDRKQSEIIKISIHALREEGDLRGVLSAPSALHFYPRPPRGGRLHFLRQTSGAVSDFYPRPPRGGRPRLQRSVLAGARFLSTPSARRATTLSGSFPRRNGDFYPRPPRGGRLGVETSTAFAL